MSTFAETPPETPPEPVPEPALDFPPDVPLRIARGHAEPEELAALTVILYTRLAHLRAAADRHEPEPPAASRHAAGARPSCWSGCWTCG